MRILGVLRAYRHRVAISSSATTVFVNPAQAGIQGSLRKLWIPACTGLTTVDTTTMETADIHEITESSAGNA